MSVQISFVHNRKKDDSIEVRVYFQKIRKRVYFSTGVKCQENEWQDNGYIKSKAPDSDLKNTILQSKISTIRELVKKQILEFDFVDVNKLKKDFKNKTQEQDKGSKNFCNYLKFCLNSGALANLKQSTKKNYLKVVNKMALAKIDDFNLDEITPLVLNQFDNFLKANGAQNNTRWSYFKCIKRVMAIAVRDGEIKAEQNPFFNDRFKARYQKTEKTALTLEELKKIEDCPVSDGQEIIKDMFLLACYTGLRFTDVNNLCNKLIKQSSDKYYLSIVNAKTGKSNPLPIQELFNGKPLKICLKYFNQHQDKVSTAKWFNFTNEYVNRELKKIQSSSGIETVLTFHVARHSCCTFLVADFKIKPSIAQKILGHSSLKMTEQYLHVRGTHIEDSLKGVSWE